MLWMAVIGGILLGVAGSLAFFLWVFRDFNVWH